MLFFMIKYVRHAIAQARYHMNFPHCACSHLRSLILLFPYALNFYSLSLCSLSLSYSASTSLFLFFFPLAPRSIVFPPYPALTHLIVRISPLPQLLHYFLSLSLSLSPSLLLMHIFLYLTLGYSLYIVWRQTVMLCFYFFFTLLLLHIHFPCQYYQHCLLMMFSAATRGLLSTKSLTASLNTGYWCIFLLSAHTPFISLRPTFVYRSLSYF